MPSRPIDDQHQPRRESHHDRDRQREGGKGETRSGANPTAGTSRRTSSTRQLHDDEEDRIGPYLIGEEIGRGSFATVYRGERHDTGALVAIKSVIRSKLTTKLLENLESEISILKRITHRNIVELKDCLKTDAHIYLIMAFCSAGDLSIYIRKRGDLAALTASNQGLLPEARGSTELDPKRVMYPHPKEGGLNETIVRCFLGQLVDALKFLRSQNIIHRDIKPQNLLLQPAGAADLAAGHPPGIPVLKVADFGFARWLPQQSLAETLCGSPLYMAPEILRYEKYDAKADLWSVGAVLFEMSVGRPPFRAQNHVDLLRKIERGEDKIKFPDEKKLEEGSEKVPTKVAPDLKALVRRLLKRNPSERMTFDEFFREASAVANGGSAAELSAAEDISARHSANAALARAHRPPPSIPRVASTSAAPTMSLPQASTNRSDARDAFLVTAAAAAYASPPAPVVTPSPKLESAEKPDAPASRAASYGDPEPLPFARRTSAVVTPSGLSAQRRPPGSTASRQSNEGVGQADSLTQRRASETSPGVPGTTPPTAIDRFANTHQKTLADSMSDSNDSVLGKDYVVVEKRTVEINALADELASMPKRDGNIARRPSRGFLSRPPSSTGPTPAAILPSSSPTMPYPPSAPSTNAAEVAATPPFAIQAQPRNSPSPHPYSLSSSPRPLSFLSSSPRSITHPIERFPGSPLALVGSPTAAIAKALNMASLKIFGSPTDGILVRRSSARRPINRSAQVIDPEEDKVLSDLEDSAQKALVLFDFADSKIMQILPPTPQTSSSTSLGTPSYFSHVAAREQAASNPFSAVPTPSSPQMRRASSSSSDRPLVMASSAKADVLAAEAVVLYLKSLAFLHKGIERARTYWLNRPPDSVASSDFNDAVQWFRQRFNECFDKADFAKSRCQDEIPESAGYAEKLIYERALELSRAAAINELRGENPTDCETAYETALWMLYAILDGITSCSTGQPAEDEDCATVNKFVASITARLQALRKKIG